MNIKMTPFIKKTFCPGTVTLTAALIGLTGAPASAEESMETIVVVGQVGSLGKALREQRNANTIKSVVHADAIAQLPDDNAAEALQRLPGVSVQRDQGEGRFVSVRGLGPEFNSVTINGTLMPAAEEGRRAVALDVLPSELVQSLSVVKSLTPDMDANSLGGTVEVHSLSALDHDDLFYSFSIESGYDENTDQFSPKASGVISDRFSIAGGEDNLGVALALSWQDRKFGSDNVETGGGWDLPDEALEELELRRYTINRERIGMGLNFDYQASEDTLYYLRTLYSRFSDDEVRQAMVVEFDPPVFADAMGDAEITRELKAREEVQSVRSAVLGTEQSHGNWWFRLQAAHSESREKNPGGIGDAVFEADIFSGVGFSNTRLPQLNAPEAVYRSNRYTLEEVEWEVEGARDTESNVQVDLARNYDFSGNEGQWKFGFKHSDRRKTNDTDVWVFEDFDDLGVDTAMASYEGEDVDYELGRFGPSINPLPVLDLVASLDRDAFWEEEDSRIEDYRIDETISAAYLMHSLELGSANWIAGVRYESTELESEGTGLVDGDYQATQGRESYDHILPSLHLTYQLGGGTQLRAGISHSVVRPTFEQLAPIFVIDDDEAEFGNPNLEPLESRNFDLGIERYFGRAGLISMYAFHKDIDNFIYSVDLAGTGDWVDFDEAYTFANGDNASLHGLELAYSQQLDFLPGLWRHTLVGANATVSRTDATATQMVDGESVTREVRLPNQSDQVGNFLLGWEDDRLSVRLAANYQSSSLDELALLDEPEFDIYTDRQLFVDVTLRYYLSENLQVYLEAQNITDEHYYLYTGRRDLNAQYEQYGPSYRVGVTLSRF